MTAFPGVCLVTSGAGATNLLTGMAAAYVAHSPVVVLVGGVSREHSQKDAFQAELLQALRERLDHLEAKRGAYALTKQALKIQRLEPHLYTGGGVRNGAGNRDRMVRVRIPLVG